MPSTGCPLLSRYIDFLSVPGPTLSTLLPSARAYFDLLLASEAGGDPIPTFDVVLGPGVRSEGLNPAGLDA
jgi:hypothetical protein